ncbi:acyl-CoA N-acyltransferase [Pestalotiopsis sp. NC0098]|nr:acyl-CoA N-acyltransferase [Pestalotiopsis sp. NC0098]
MDITIAQATLEDLPALAEVNRSSYSDEAASRFAHKNWRDEKHMYEFFKGRLSGRFNDEATQVLKAVDRDTDKIVGFACFTLETGNETGPTPTAMMAQKMPPSMNKDFIVAAGTEMENLREHMRGEKHYYLSTFAVASECQGRGIGSQLLQYCLEISDKASLPCWLIAFPASYQLYLRFGFEKVDHRDIDLNAWDNYKFRGYGIYRNYAMVRRPQ